MRLPAGQLSDMTGRTEHRRPCLINDVEADGATAATATCDMSKRNTITGVGRGTDSSSIFGWKILFMKPILGDLNGYWSGSSTWIFHTPPANGAAECRQSRDKMWGHRQDREYRYGNETRTHFLLGHRSGHRTPACCRSLGSPRSPTSACMDTVQYECRDRGEKELETRSTYNFMTSVSMRRLLGELYRSEGHINPPRPTRHRPKWILIMVSIVLQSDEYGGSWHGSRCESRERGLRGGGLWRRRGRKRRREWQYGEEG